MAEFFFTAAWTAGFLEGCSVLNDANKKQDDARRRSTPLLLVPSILYSTAALPLGIIGASPGPSLVAWFPFAPSVLESNTGKKVSVTLSESSTSPKTKKDAITTNVEAITPNTLDDAEAETEIQDENHRIMSRHELVRKMREDNKRALLAMQQQKQQTQPPVAERRQPPQQVVAQTRAPRKFISTLGGHSLSTPLAEAMRRARFLCIGASLVLTVASYEQARQRELERERAFQREQQRNGRDVNAMQSFVKENVCANGSVVRLMKSRDSIQKVTRGVIPLVYGHSAPSSSLRGSNAHEANNNNDSTFWNLGTTPQEWRQMTLAKDWLFQTSERSRDSIQKVARGVIPLVYGHSVPSSSSLKGSNANDEASSNYSPFWNLGTTPQEWRQMPLTKDWLFQTNNDGNGSLVLEADLSSDSLSDYLSQQDSTPTIQSMENVRWVSKILDMIAQHNGVVSPSGETVEDEKSSSGCTVVIGCGKRPLELSELDNVIYIDGTASVASKVYSVLEEMNSRPLLGDELEVEPTTDDEGDEKGSALVSALDYVGMKLRQGGTLVVTTIGGIFSRREEKNVYVVSDHSFAPLWLRQVMPYEWTVIAFDALDNVESIQEMKEGGVTFVCCQTDEASSAIVCSLLLNGGDAHRVVALVQDESCASSLRELAIDLKKETAIEIVSVKGVHADLFGQAWELLSSGTAPEEVEESIPG